MTSKGVRPAVEYLNGVAIPIGDAKRLLIVDRTRIEAQAWSRFNVADLYIGAGTPIVYTMCHRSLVRLKESVDAALEQFDAEDAHDS